MTLGLLMCIILLSGAATPLYAETGYGLSIDGDLIMTEAAPINHQGSILVPMRDIFEGLGAQVAYDAGTRQITGQYGKVKIVMKLGAKEADRNGETLAMQQPPVLMDGRVYLPVRFIGEALGVKVSYNSQYRIVEVFSENVGLIYQEQLPVRDSKDRPLTLHHQGNVRLLWSQSAGLRAGEYVAAASAGPNGQIWLKTMDDLLVVDAEGKLQQRSPLKLTDSTYIMASVSGTGYTYSYLEDTKTFPLKDVGLPMADWFLRTAYDPVPVMALRDVDGQLIVQTDEGVAGFDETGRQVWMVGQEELGLFTSKDDIADFIWSMVADGKERLYLLTEGRMLVLDDHRQVINREDTQWYYPEVLPDDMLMDRGSLYKLEDGSYRLVASPPTGPATDVLSIDKEDWHQLHRVDPLTGQIRWSYRLKSPNDTSGSLISALSFEDDADHLYATTNSGYLYGFDGDGKLRFTIDSPYEADKMNVVPLSRTTFLVAVGNVLLCFEYQ